MATLNSGKIGARQVFIWNGTYADRHLPKAAGFSWNADLKIWVAYDAQKAKALICYASPETSKKILELTTKIEETTAASKATDANIDVPSPEGLTYLPYQLAGIKYLTENNNALLADEQGLGKTIQCAGAINADSTLSSILIICPASLRLNWKRELEKWLVRPVTIDIADTKVFPETDIVITNYDVMKKLRKDVDARTWDLLICDESQYIKNYKAQRSVAIVGGNGSPAIKSRKKFFLTGTPILNRPCELWTTVSALFPSEFNFWGFHKYYCAGYQGKYGWDFTGASHLDELELKLRSTGMIRRLKADVLPELPAKRRQVIVLNTNGAANLIKKEAKLLKNFKEGIESLTPQSEGFEEISNVRRELALKKVPHAVEIIRDAVESTGKVVIFAHHKDVVKSLYDALSDFNPVVLTGDTPMQTRQDNVDRFQSDPSCRVFIGNIQAAGTGITLTASSTVLFVESAWNPGTLNQAEDRCHRIGQKNSVLIQHIVFDGSLDAHMAQTIISKQDIITKALDGGAEAMEADLTDAKKQVEREQAEKKAAEKPVAITTEQIDAVHQGLKMLAGVCDGALKQDGQGFNGVDAQFGHNLANRAFLTPGQALAARKMIHKYKGQLGQALVDSMSGQPLESAGETTGSESRA